MHIRTVILLGNFSFGLMNFVNFSTTFFIQRFLTFFFNSWSQRFLHLWLRTSAGSVKTAVKEVSICRLHSCFNVALASGRQSGRTRRSITVCSLLRSCRPAKPHHAGYLYKNGPVVIRTTSGSVDPVRPCAVITHIDCSL